MPRATPKPRAKAEPDWPDEVPRLLWTDICRYGDRDGDKRSLLTWLAESFQGSDLRSRGRDALVAAISRRHQGFAAGKDLIVRFNRNWPDLEAIANAWNAAMADLGYG